MKVSTSAIIGVVVLGVRYQRISHASQKSAAHASRVIRVPMVSRVLCMVSSECA